MMAGKNIDYEMSSRDRGIAVGGIGAMHLLTQRLGLAKAIDGRLHLLKVHLPYSESDHVLNFAYNALAGGTCIEDMELLRCNEGYLNTLGAQRIPDPTTAGDFCRRFQPVDIDSVQEAFNDRRVAVWKRQPPSFFDEARNALIYLTYSDRVIEGSPKNSISAVVIRDWQPAPSTTPAAQ